jgi:hypothetical protein
MKCDMRGARTSRLRRREALSLAAVLLGGGAACAERPLPADAGVLPDAVYSPCQPGTRAGAARVALISPTAVSSVPDGAGFTSVDAVVTNGVHGFDYSITVAVEGACRLLERPTCAPECAGQTTCGPGSSCVASPTAQDVGTVFVDGLAVPLELTSFAASGFYSQAIVDPFPPVAPDAPVTFATSGGAYAPFSLEARGVEVLAFDGADLNVGRGRSLDLTWTAPARPGAARIQAILSLQPSLSKSIIECTFPDTGAASIPASLIDPLLDRGTNGFPTVALTRRTVASTTIVPGCVQFEVTARVTRRVSVDGVTFCADTAECPPPLTCQLDYTCG